MGAKIEPRAGHPATPHSGRMRHALARLGTEVLAPAPIVAGLLLVVAWQSAPTPLLALGWAALAVLFCSLLPMLYVVAGVRRRRLSDRHVRRREQRLRPLLVANASVLAGLALLRLGGAPVDLVAMVAAGAAGLAVFTLVTLRFKLSFHAGVAAGAVTILAALFGPAALASAGLVVLVGWARIELGDHSLAQVVVGATLGAAIAAGVFGLFR